MNSTRRNFLKTSVGSAALIAASAAIANSEAKTRVPLRKFGRHADLVSVVGIGGHTLYMSGSQREADEIVNRAIELGINFFDNAWDYHDGEAEKYMGNALQGKRDQVFLMSKLCGYHIGKRDIAPTLKGSMKTLEDSLQRLKTDHLDLWLMHQVSHDDADDAYRADGSIEAMELAKKQGKIRYTGFSGHTDPKIHIDLIERGYGWDATLMPVSACGAMKSRAFEKEVMPLCEKKNIAVLGMKGFGGSRRTELHGKTSITEVMRYSLSYPQLCTQLIGIDKLEYVDQAAAASKEQPMTAQERAQHAVAYAPGTGQYAAMMRGEKLYQRGCYHDEDHQHG